MASGLEQSQNNGQEEMTQRHPNLNRAHGAKPKDPLLQSQNFKLEMGS
jgi:hypothetical protein